ncbi:MAG TPA: DUF6152 family protein [Bryobacteraceae bacterium]|nr:DUF6152 family protein [Bryobacteraceae bacterium]
MRTTIVALLAGFALGAALPVFAHHSFSAEYDQNQPITLKGTVTKLEWMNPHVYNYIDVKDQKGNVKSWAIEAGAPNGLYRAGWRKDSLKVGDVVTVEGYRAKDSGDHVNGRSVTLADGRRVFAGAADDGGPNSQYR